MLVACGARLLKIQNGDQLPGNGFKDLSNSRMYTYQTPSTLAQHSLSDCDTAFDYYCEAWCLFCGHEWLDEHTGRRRRRVQSWCWMSGQIDK